MEQEEIVEQKVSQKKSIESTTDRINSMRKRADLSDIILEKEKNVVNKKKKVILSAATLVLVFLIFLIISKLINSSSNEQKNSENKKADIIVNNDSKKLPQIKKSNEDTIIVANNENKEISETDLKFEEMVKKLKEEDIKENGSIIETPTPQKIVEKDSNPKVIDKTEDTSKTIQKEVQKNTTPIKTAEKKIIISSNKPTNNKNNKIDINKKIVKEEQKQPVKQKIIPSFSNKSGYFIQVAATATPQPKRSLIRSIRENGFTYTTHPIYVKGRKFYKILIGPYKSRNDALRRIGKIKSTINPQAYIIHLR